MSKDEFDKAVPVDVRKSSAFPSGHPRFSRLCRPFLPMPHKDGGIAAISYDITGKAQLFRKSSGKAATDASFCGLL